MITALKTLAVDKIKLLEKFELFSDYWSPKIIGALNGQQVKLAKFKGEFIFHQHENEDELFMVVKGKFKMEFRDKTVEVNEGEIIIVPRGVEHKPVADEEVWAMLFEPASTLNTGNIINEKTKTQLDTI
jgi:mannose-6-phosphate isomerase-like protein (cupin superfamily)